MRADMQRQREREFVGEIEPDVTEMSERDKRETVTETERHAAG